MSSIVHTSCGILTPINADANTICPACLAVLITHTESGIRLTTPDVMLINEQQTPGVRIRQALEGQGYAWPPRPASRWQRVWRWLRSKV